MTEIVDFDKEFGFATKKKATPTIVVKLFQREWHLLASVNTFTFTRMAGNDIASIGEFIANAVIEEERADWQRELARTEMDGDELALLVRRLVEVVSEPHPTKSPSASRSSASKRTSGRNSAVVSSSARASASQT